MIVTKLWYKVWSFFMNDSERNEVKRLFVLKRALLLVLSLPNTHFEWKCSDTKFQHRIYLDYTLLFLTFSHAFMCVFNAFLIIMSLWLFKHTIIFINIHLLLLIWHDKKREQIGCKISNMCIYTYVCLDICKYVDFYNRDSLTV